MVQAKKIWSWRGLVLLLAMLQLYACQENTISEDPNLQLTFSHDTMLFDTVFTAMGSSTRKIMVYNPNKNAVNIEQVRLQNGAYFHINLDGENNIDKLRNLVVRGGDSLFLFVRAYIDPQSEDSPVLIEDKIAFGVNGKTQQITLQAYGQNIEKIQGKNGLKIYPSLHLTSTKPYVIYDTVVVSGELVIDKGTTIYMHEGALIHAYGSVYAEGSKEEPIIFRGDRTDRLFDSVPYRMVSGQWDGLYLLYDGQGSTPEYKLNFVEVLSGSVGLYAYSSDTHACPHMSLTNSRIHNHSVYGLILQNIDAEVVNCEISNCASYCVYLAGGKHEFVHNTIAAYYGYPYTTLNIHTNPIAEDVAAVYINNLSKKMAKTQSSFKNCIITGGRKNNVVVATPLPENYEGIFIGNYMQADSLPESYAENNVYATEADTAVFNNIYYRYKEYHYYDFGLDSLSPARGIADSITTLSYPIDRSGIQRKAKADAGCYEYVL